ncbi:hypothetical protein HU200_041082 [Digitaria exilis]|uniref:Bifunctional inhibitor/plant lipid transfer protein/seed storage helical domain-containing protein n=1 Tax=Digitaria exilis TaxID=1010633 RepID=A0A835B8A6_9POAL|nr:hypothetical protein HU200_041082 [Digitaria exilis]
MAKSQAMGALLTILFVLDTSAEMAHGICNLSSNGIKACQPAAAIRNPVDQPSAECCAALAGADLSCLCRYKNAAGVWVRFYRIDINRAMGLPGKCGLSMPANC